MDRRTDEWMDGWTDGWIGIGIGISRFGGRTVPQTLFFGVKLVQIH